MCREKKKVHAREAQNKGLFLSPPPCLEDLQHGNVQPTSTGGFMLLAFSSVLHNEVIYL